MTNYPDWVILHVPHHSKYIPPELREQFLLDDHQLTQELILMTDEGSKDLFNYGGDHTRLVQAAVSRLVVDVERFEDDAQETMAKKGMGVVYTKTAHGQPLRRPITNLERVQLLEQYYYPHHKVFENQVDEIIQRYNHCLIIDCHSFNSRPLPYEYNQNNDRPDICIGTDSFHTPDELTISFVKVFKEAGCRVAINKPFAGTIVPLKFYGHDSKVQSIMVEVNKRLYMDESNGKLNEKFSAISELVTSLCIEAITK